MVSVIIPVYNREKYIEECLRSVLAQSYRDIEIVLVDDGSTDNTADICRRMAVEDHRIRILTGEHKGVSAARNMALDAAGGEYVFFLDSDDVIHPSLLEILASAMDAASAEMGGTDVIHVAEKNWSEIHNISPDQIVAGKTILRTHEEALDSVLTGKSPLSCIGGVMIRRNFIGDTRFRTDLYIGEDYYFIYENFVKGASCVFTTEKYYYVRLHAGNCSWDYSFRGFQTRFLRRELVWKREETFGRKKYADIQKRDAFSSFTTCIRRHKPYSEDSRKMRQMLRQYRKEIMPALPAQSKFLCTMFCSLPATALLLLRLKDKLK